LVDTLEMSLYVSVDLAPSSSSGEIALAPEA